MPPLNGVIETALYVDNLDRASRFYEDVLGLSSIDANDRLRAFGVAGHSVLLLFKRGASNHVMQLSDGTIGPHDGHGKLHLAFSISKDDLAAWEAHLAAKNVLIESTVRWPRGGISVYFRDPDDNLVELATPGLWSIY